MKQTPRSHACTVGLLFALVGVLGGCGSETASPGARLRVLTSPLDGAFEGTLQVQLLDDPDAPVQEAVRVGDDAELYYAPGAPNGRYRVFTDAGWGMLWVPTMGAATPYLRGPDHPAAPVRLGKPRTLYVGPTDPRQWQLGRTWGADYKAAERPTDPFAPSEPVVAHHPEGLVSLEFSPEHWKAGNVIRVLGQMTSGHVTNLLSYVVRDAMHPEFPRIALVHGAEHVPLTVWLVSPAADGGPVPDGTVVRTALAGVPFPKDYESGSFRGVARFAGIPVVSGELQITLAGWPRPFVLAREDWRREGGVYLVATGPDAPARRCPPPAVADAPANAVVAAHVRPAGAADFGRVLLEEGDLLAPAGPQEWFLHLASGAWAHVFVDVPDGPAPPRRADEVVVKAGCRLKGKVQGGGMGYRVVARLVLPAAKDEVSGVELPERTVGGFEAAASAAAEYDVRVPPGRVELQVVSPAGSRSRHYTMDLRPGDLVRRDLNVGGPR